MIRASCLPSVHCPAPSLSVVGFAAGRTARRRCAAPSRRWATVVDDEVDDVGRMAAAGEADEGGGGNA